MQKLIRALLVFTIAILSLSCRLFAEVGCHYTVFVPPVANSSCECVGSSCGVYVNCHGGYNKCMTCLGSGNSGCTTALAFDYFDYAPCNSAIDGVGLTKCILAMMGAGLTDAAAVAPCVNPVTGIIGWSTGPCEAAMAAVATVNAGALLECQYCNWHKCAVDATTVHVNWVQISSATGKACGAGLPPCNAKGTATGTGGTDKS
jgi:hypothetical protein